MTKEAMVEIVRIENCALAYEQIHSDLKAMSLLEFVDEMKKSANTIAAEYKDKAAMPNAEEVDAETTRYFMINRLNRIVATYAQLHYDLKEMTPEQFLEVCSKDAAILAEKYKF